MRAAVPSYEQTSKPQDAASDTNMSLMKERVVNKANRLTKTPSRILKHLVSKKKKRFETEGFDLVQYTCSQKEPLKFGDRERKYM